MRHWTARLPDLAAYADTHDVLHVGAGRTRGYGTSLDVSPDVGADIVADLMQPLPLPDKSYDAVYAFNILEHLPDLVSVLGELHRIVRPGGIIVVLVPHFSSSSAFIDPTHRRGFSYRTFDYFVEGTSMFQDFGWYSAARFKIRERQLLLESGILHRTIGGLINRHADTYERHWCYLLRGAGLFVELEVV